VSLGLIRLFVATIPSRAVAETEVVPKCAPRLSPRLVAALERLDDGKLPIAELLRLVGAEADRLGLPRPSYERVRVLAHELRARRAEPTTGEVLWDVAWRVRPPDAITKHISGTLDPK
jgi:hypothetical protein